MSLRSRIVAWVVARIPIEMRRWWQDHVSDVPVHDRDSSAADKMTSRQLRRAYFDAALLGVRRERERTPAPPSRKRLASSKNALWAWMFDRDERQ